MTMLRELDPFRPLHPSKIAEVGVALGPSTSERGKPCSRSNYLTTLHTLAAGASRAGSLKGSLMVWKSKRSRRGLPAWRAPIWRIDTGDVGNEVASASE